MTRTRWLQTAALLLVGVLILYGLLRTVHPAEVGAAIARASPGLVLIGMGSSIGFLLIRGWRWQLILAASAPATRLADVTAVTAIGFALNSVSPFKLGEFLRIALISQRTQIGVGEAGATVVLERILDVLALLVLALVAALLSGGASNSVGVWSGLAILSIVSLALGLTGYLMVRHPAGSLRVANALSRGLPRRLQTPVLQLAASVLRGLSLLRSPGRFALTGAVSVAVSIVSILGLIAYFRSITSALTPANLFLAMTLFVITQAVSITPGSVGTYEGFFVLVLGAFVAGHGSALTAVAVVSHVGTILSFLIAGCVGALWLRLSPDGLPVRLERPTVGQDRA